MDYLAKSFWRGAFILFSKMSDNIYPIVENIIEKGRISIYLETVEAMLKVRTPSEQDNLSEILQQNLILDKYDAYL